MKAPPMTASIKEALEHIRSLSGLDDKLIEGASIVVCQRVAEIHQHADAALASLESGDARERIARIIDPGSFYIRDESNGLMCTVECNGALAAADAILATGLVPDEAAIRADERERCAKVVDVQLQWDDREEIAAAIRAGRAEG